ncbi:L-tyrosine/L-tryptophan isonitrile synthase family protein [Thauera butanivorans]|uniref:L-tyrosine/L-tryptophan isonitrile synthase family protein n=1 Tax=Thauera butanivorans TaxID=86174 RepID=UPI0012FBB93C|nr:L-tyrosine/L-tryptophan isonitrile synthase family protein [Thauera butanivorans]
MSEPLSVPASAANQQLPVGLSGEIISRSQIGHEFVWPKNDPRSQWQPQRTYGPSDDARIRRLSISPHFDMDAFLERTKTLDLPSRIIELLNHNAFQFNSRKKFRECDQWRQVVTEACEKGAPIEILILAFCVISNPTKRVQPTEVTTADDVSLLHMDNIARHIANIYPPGATFHVISDSTFYALPLGVTSVEAQNYLVQLRRRTEDLQIAETIKIHDISDYLSYYNQFFHERFEIWCAKFLADPLSHDLPVDEYQRWHASMRATLNSRRMGFSYEQQLAALFCADSGISLAQLDDSATLALAEYRALKAAAADTNWEKRHFPNAIRATIHAKKIPVLGLRLYPEYKLGSRLLPYHGIAVLVSGDNDDAERMEIRHEITVIGNPSFTRVIDEKGLTQFYEPSKPSV